MQAAVEAAEDLAEVADQKIMTLQKLMVNAASAGPPQVKNLAC